MNRQAALFMLITIYMGEKGTAVPYVRRYRLTVADHDILLVIPDL